ncbi:sulfurtransferase [Sediminibacillus albus]|uniref:Thiosulfate/3-mercaptopyruvate sulfurtransferase n=1 Tax=Sediminibacillus albus TaxID=407036 RepID=A0A1G9AJN2_9BACI|nr:sulfurtransferase [Sediminibacillus albus]SDK27478.1 thiosulfate/3-mercaptopyruvate sulfurtransferase [Sediminibacillus albus]
MSFLITADELYQRLLGAATENIAVVDVRFHLADPSAGKKAYLEGHIPNAVYLDLNQHLSGELGDHGGSHPLPDQEAFVNILGRSGIDEQTMVIVYDQENDMFAARCCWLLQYFGHSNVFILDGGLNAWINQGYQLSRDIPAPIPKTFVPRPRDKEVVDMKQLKQKMRKEESILIDSRSYERYIGETEPLYAKAGHIPGAKNYFWKDVLTEDGHWKSIKELKEHFSDLPKQKEIIVSCGSGVSACPNILALQAAGYSNVKLYPGSFSDWISYPDNQVATGEE